MAVSKHRGYAAHVVLQWQKFAKDKQTEGYDSPAANFLGLSDWKNANGTELGLLEIAESTLRLIHYGLMDDPDPDPDSDALLGITMQLSFMAGVAMGMAEAFQKATRGHFRSLEQ